MPRHRKYTVHLSDEDVQRLKKLMKGQKRKTVKTSMKMSTARKKPSISYAFKDFKTGSTPIIRSKTGGFKRPPVLLRSWQNVKKYWGFRASSVLNVLCLQKENFAFEKSLLAKNVNENVNENGNENGNGFCDGLLTLIIMTLEMLRDDFLLVVSKIREHIVRLNKDGSKSCKYY